eukprot:gene7683-21683_t
MAVVPQQSKMTEGSRLALEEIALAAAEGDADWDDDHDSGEVEVRMCFNDGVALALVTPSQEQGAPSSRLDWRRSSTQTASTVPADPWWASPARKSNVRVQVCFNDTPDVALVTPSQDHMERPIPLLQKAMLWAAPAAAKRGRAALPPPLPAAAAQPTAENSAHGTARPRRLSRSPPSTPRASPRSPSISDHGSDAAAPRPSVGDRVRLAPEVVAEQEAGQGCLRVGSSEEGVVLMDEGDDQ